MTTHLPPEGLSPRYDKYNLISDTMSPGPTVSGMACAVGGETAALLELPGWGRDSCLCLREPSARGEGTLEVAG